jgi:hypothetical protein
MSETKDTQLVGYDSPILKFDKTVTLRNDIDVDALIAAVGGPATLFVGRPYNPQESVASIANEGMTGTLTLCIKFGYGNYYYYMTEALRQRLVELGLPARDLNEPWYSTRNNRATSNVTFTLSPDQSEYETRNKDIPIPAEQITKILFVEDCFLPLKDPYIINLFINEAKPALSRHSGGGDSGGSGVTSAPDIDEQGWRLFKLNEEITVFVYAAYTPPIVKFVAPADGKYVFKAADGEENAWCDTASYKQNSGCWDRDFSSLTDDLLTSYEFEATAGQEFFFWVSTWDEMPGTVRLILESVQ